MTPLVNPPPQPTNKTWQGDDTAEGDVEHNPGPSPTEQATVAPFQNSRSHVALVLSLNNNGTYVNQLYNRVITYLSRAYGTRTEPYQHHCATLSPQQPSVTRLRSKSSQGSPEGMTAPVGPPTPRSGSTPLGTPPPAPKGSPPQSHMALTSTPVHQPTPSGHMTRAVHVLCPRCNMADIPFFRCTTCRYFALNQPESPNRTTSLYESTHADPVFPRDNTWQHVAMEEGGVERNSGPPWEQPGPKSAPHQEILHANHNPHNGVQQRATDGTHEAATKRRKIDTAVNTNSRKRPLLARERELSTPGKENPRPLRRHGYHHH